MGLDMSLMRANLHGYSPRQAKVVSSYYGMVAYNEKHPEKQSDLMSWCRADPSELDMGAVEALRPEYQLRYFLWDEDKVFGRPNIFEEVAYWRMANAIHGWFVRNVQGGNDDCGIYAVTKKQLEQLKALCVAVLAGNSDAAKNLPTEDGYHFGDTAYDEGYIQDLRNTVEQLEKVLNETDWEVQTVCYEASW